MDLSANIRTTALPVWITDSQIDPSWIEEKMPIFQQITECVVEDISNENRKGPKIKDGTTLRLKLNHQGNENKKVETTLIVKQVPSAGLTLSRKLGLAREAIFYKTLAPKIKISSSNDDKEGASSNDRSILESCIPKIYYSYGDMSDGAKIVFMEDLSRDFIDSGILFGPGNPNNWKRNLDNMVAAAYPLAVPTSFEVTNQTFLAIADVHATFWKDKKLLSEEYGWLRGSSWISGKDPTSWWGSQNMIQTMWGLYLKDSNDSGNDIIWDTRVRKIVEKAMKGISWESHRRRLNENTHFCLVHGDFWPGNVMIAKDLPQNTTKIRNLRLLDWEMVGLGSGPQDLGQYILSNMKPSERRECEDKLIRNYYEKLVSSLGVRNFSWEECWFEYKIGGVERFIWFLVYFCAQPDLVQWAQYFHNQIKDFIHDHDISPEDITQPRP